MREWWDRLLASPRALAAVGVSVAVVVAVAALLLVTDGGDDTPASAASSSNAPSKGSSDSPAPTATASKGPRKVLPPDKDEYCPAFRQIQKGGLTSPGDEEDEHVDLAELSRTFDQLISRYSAAERVSPLSLRDNYAQALGYLRQGKKAVSSKDVVLLKALVVNLESLNRSMEAIQTKSATFCS